MKTLGKSPVFPHVQRCTAPRAGCGGHQNAAASFAWGWGGWLLTGICLFVCLFVCLFYFNDKPWPGRIRWRWTIHKALQKKRCQSKRNGEALQRFTPTRKEQLYNSKTLFPQTHPTIFFVPQKKTILYKPTTPSYLLTYLSFPNWSPPRKKHQTGTSFYFFFSTRSLGVSAPYLTPPPTAPPQVAVNCNVSVCGAAWQTKRVLLSAEGFSLVDRHGEAAGKPKPKESGWDFLEM